MQTSGTPSSSSLRGAAWLGMGILLLVQLLTVEIDPLWGRPVGADAQEMLYLGQVLDRGGRLYADVAHPGFPAVGLLGYLCVRLGALLGVLPTTALVLVHLAWSLAVATLARLAVARRGLAGPLADLFLVAVYVALTGFPTRPMLAQPEAFAAAALIPVLLFPTTSGQDPLPERVGGALAGVGLWLEPTLALLPLAMAARDLAAEPARLRGPLYQGLLVGGLLGCATLLAVPDLAAFRRWGPAWRYGAGRALASGGAAALRSALEEGWYVAIGLLVAVPIGLARSSGPLRRAMVEGALGAALALLLAVVAWEGHPEHQLPWLLLSMVTGVLALTVGFYPEGYPLRAEYPGADRERRVLPVVAVLLALGGVGGWCAKIGKYYGGDTVERALAGLPPGEAVAVLTNDAPTDPLTPYRLGRGQGTRFTWARYLAPGMRRLGDPAVERGAALGRGHAEVVRLLLEDLERSRPAALLLERASEDRPADGASVELPVSVEAHLLSMDETARLLRTRYVRDELLRDGRYRRYLRRDLVEP